MIDKDISEGGFMRLTKNEKQLVKLYVDTFQESYEKNKNYLGAMAHIRAPIDHAAKECWKRFP